MANLLNDQKLLPSDGPGLMDPCEKEPTDVLDNMVPQDREEITVNAQVAFCLDWAWLKIVAWQPSGKGGGVLLQENHETTPGREQLHHLLGGSSETKFLFSSSSLSSKLCGCSPSDRYTRSWAWSLCPRPRPALATANAAWTAATQAKARGRARKTKRKKPTPLDRCFCLGGW